MNKVQITVAKYSVNVANEHYEYLLAVSTNTLCVLSKDKKIVQTIVDGDDRCAYMFVAVDENVFLDALSAIKKCLLKGHNPLLYLNLI
jgi:hypothetical protein